MNIRRPCSSKILLACALAASAAGALAQEAPDWSLVVHGLSHHARPRPLPNECNCGYESLNAGLGLRARLSPSWSVQAGAYRNSVRDASAYLMADWTGLSSGPWSAGAFGGAASGYYDSGDRAGGRKLRGVLGAFGRVELPIAKSALELRVIPDAKATRANIFALELDVGF